MVTDINGVVLKTLDLVMISALSTYQVQRLIGLRSRGPLQIIGSGVMKADYAPYHMVEYVTVHDPMSGLRTNLPVSWVRKARGDQTASGISFDELMNFLS